MATIIIGGGQAGLALSRALLQRGHDHVVLEQAAGAGYAWRDQRWDSFTFVTPNRMSQLPGLESPGDPDGYLARDAIVAYFEQYVTTFKLPVRFGVRVTAVEQAADGYRVTTADGETLTAENVVVATGMFQGPKIPPCSANFPVGIIQLHASQYRNPQRLPPGAVLVVGGGQSGCQIAEELYQNGRRVYLAIGGIGRIPRRYRGRDGYFWAEKIGMLDRTPAMLPSPQAKFSGNPQLTGAKGGHDLSLHQFARDGVTLLGHVLDSRGHKLILASDVQASLAKGDQMTADFVRTVDAYIEKQELDLPTERLPELRDGYDQPEILELDLEAAGITSVIWATGFTFDYSLVQLSVTDADGFPLQERGVTAYPGLYFLGMPYLHKQKSGLLWGVGEDADYLAEHIVARVGR